MNDNVHILVVVDMQNDFVTGSLAVPGAKDIIPKISKLIKEEYTCDDYIHNKCVIFTRDSHASNYLNTSEGKLIPIKHCIVETPGWCIVDKLWDYADKTCIINKPSFGFDNWYNYIRKELDIFPKTITLVGVASDICVISNAIILKSIWPEIPVRIISDCCAGTTKEKHFEAMDIIKGLGIEIINLECVEGG